MAEKIYSCHFTGISGCVFIILSACFSVDINKHSVLEKPRSVLFFRQAVSVDFHYSPEQLQFPVISELSKTLTQHVKLKGCTLADSYSSILETSSVSKENRCFMSVGS